MAATIRHAEESYSLDDGYGLFAANSGDGEIVLAADIVEAGRMDGRFASDIGGRIGDGYAENGDFGIAAARRESV